MVIFLHKKDAYLSIQHNLDLLQWTKFGELFVQFTFSCIQTETKYSETSAFLWIFPASNMSSSC